MAEWVYWAVLVPFQLMHLKGGAAFIHSFILLIYIVVRQPQREHETKLTVGSAMDTTGKNMNLR